MLYSFTPSGIVTVEFDFEELTLAEFQTEFDAFDTALKQIQTPITKFKLSWINSGQAGERGDNVKTYYNAIVASLEQLTSTLNGLENNRVSLDGLENDSVPCYLDIDFSTYEQQTDDELISSFFDFIEHFPTTHNVVNLALNLDSVRTEPANDFFTDNFFASFPVIEALTLKANFIDDESVDRMIAFIKNHEHLKSINVDLTTGSHVFDLRQIMLNESLKKIIFKHSALYPVGWDDARHKPWLISDEWKYNYWIELGRRIKQHPNLELFDLYIENDWYKNDAQTVNNVLINEFIHMIAYNRSLSKVSIKILGDNYQFNEAKTAITQRHFLEHSSLVDLALNVEGIHLNANSPAMLQLRTQTLANRENLQRLAADPNPDLSMRLHLAKYIHYFMSQAYQPINIDSMASVRFTSVYISTMLQNIKLYNLPIDLISDQVLSFLQPKEVCKLSAATGGFFHQKRFNLEEKTMLPIENQQNP